MSSSKAKYACSHCDHHAGHRSSPATQESSDSEVSDSSSEEGEIVEISEFVGEYGDALRAIYSKLRKDVSNLLDVRLGHFDDDFLELIFEAYMSRP